VLVLVLLLLLNLCSVSGWRTIDDGVSTATSTSVSGLTAGTSYYIVAWDPDHTTGESLIQLRVASAAARLTSLTRVTNGFELRFAANVSQHYTVDATATFGAGWSQIGSVTPTNSTAIFVDTAAPPQQRFYRVRSP